MRREISRIVESDHNRSTVARVGQYLRRGRREEVTTDLTIKVHAGRVLGIEERGNPDRHAPKCILRLVQHLVTETQQATKAATGHLLRDVDREATGLADDQFFVICRLRVVGHGQGVVVAADHQRLTGADEYIHRPVTLFQRRHVGELAEVVDQLVALIEDVVGDAAGGAVQCADPRVDRSQRLRKGVDLTDLAFEVAVQLMADILQPAVEGIEAIAQLTGSVEHHRARGYRGRVIGDIVDTRKKLLQRIIDTRRGIGKHVVDLPCALLKDRKLLVRRGVVANARSQVTVITASDRRHLDAGPDVTLRGNLRRARIQLHNLAAVALGIDVGDVVPCRLHLPLEGVERTDANIDDACHCFFTLPSSAQMAVAPSFADCAARCIDSLSRMR